MAKDELGELSFDEIKKLRDMLEHFSFPKNGAGASTAPAHGGDVHLEPGLRGDTEGTLDGRIVMHNPGGSSRPFMTVVDGEDEFDVYLGKERPGAASNDARRGSIYVQYGGDGPVRVHRRTPLGWS